MNANLRLMIVVNVLALVAFLYALRLAPPMENRSDPAEEVRLGTVVPATEPG